MNIRKNITLIIGIAIPLLMIGFVALSIYLPPMFAEQPQYDFVYSNSDYHDNGYYVDGETVKKYDRSQTVPLDSFPESSIKAPVPNPVIPEPKLYYYDISENASRQVSLQEAQGYKLDTNTKSPDGFEVVSGSSSGGFLFYDSYDYNSRYIRGNNISRKLNLQSDTTYYYGFRLLGWVKK